MLTVKVKEAGIKNLVVRWYKDAFWGRLLPHTSILYTQLHDVGETNASWSLVLEFDETPRKQGRVSYGEVYFMVEDAPHEILMPGFKFYFLDGEKIKGKCEVIA